MLLILDFPEPDLPISKTFFFLGFLTSLLRTSAGGASAAGSAWEAMGRDEVAGGLELEDGRIGGKAEVMEKVGGDASADGRGVAVAVAWLRCGSCCVRTELACVTGATPPETIDTYI